MFSEKQKRVLFSTVIRHRPQYVRVPLQNVNGVHELKSDLQFDRILPAYEAAKNQLLDFASNRSIYHIRIDGSAREWLPFYEKICAAYRSINGSRVLRRMRISGFRLINVVRHTFGYLVTSDSYVCGLDEVCVILDALIKLLMPSGRESVYIHYRCSAERLRIICATARNSPEWSRSWLLEVKTLENGMLKLTAPTSQLAAALNYLLTSAPSTFEKLRFITGVIAMDMQYDLGKELRQRHGETDINVLLSGYRIRRFQKFGTITKNY